MSSVGRQQWSAGGGGGGGGVGSVPSRSFVQEEEGEADSDDEIGHIDAATYKQQSSKWSAPIPMASLMQLPMHKVGWMDSLISETAQWAQMWFVLRGTVLAHFKDSEAALVSQIHANMSTGGWVARTNQWRDLNVQRAARSLLCLSLRHVVSFVSCSAAT